LTAAKNNAYAALGDWSGLDQRAATKQYSHDVPATKSAQSVANAAPKHENGIRTVSTNATFLTSKPAALVSEKPPLTSQSYQELVDKYCFVGTQGKSEEVKTH
jgi:hypothetical protein